MRMFTRVLEILIYVFTISLLIFSPLPFGSVRPLAKFILQLQAFLLFFIWLLLLLYERKKPFLNIRNYTPLLVFLLICLFQILPLPEFILRIVSEKSLDIWEKTQSVISSIGFSDEKSLFTISLYPNATWKETLLLLSYIAFGIVISRSFKSERKIKMVLIPIFAVSLFEAGYGIYQYVVSSDVATGPGIESARGTFVNRNHFAGLLEMSIPLALGYVLSIGNWEDNKERTFFKNLISSDNLQKSILLLFLLGIMILALILSKSRMGIFSGFSSLIFFYLAYSSFTRNKLQISWMLFFVLAVAVLYGLLIGIYPVFERFFQTISGEPGRILIWKDMMGIIKDFPLFGTGLGTFSYVYPLYKKSVEQPIVYVYAHNDYLQLMVETGILGFLSIMTALSLYISSSFKDLIRLYQEVDYFRFFLLLGALTGVVSILIHSLADFNLHIPSNGLYFAFFIGFSKAIGSRHE
ncbi:O-antigen ligase family protein [Desulfobacterota bacterium AH_259_B03_O07]|nr:O-antigen ligase family protein [Desulfobacterota bacterium AH_259_B03_O07]